MSRSGGAACMCLDVVQGQIGAGLQRDGKTGVCPLRQAPWRFISFSGGDREGVQGCWRGAACCAVVLRLCRCASFSSAFDEIGAAMYPPFGGDDERVCVAMGH